MPFYEYECEEHGRFTVRQPMFATHKADCLVCQEPAQRVFSLFDYRFAVPLTVLQDLGGYGDNHKGYEKIGWQADGGISPKPGQPYKTAKEVDGEQWGAIKEV